MYSKLREIRKSKNISVKYLGRVIGKSDKSYYKREAGKVKFSLSEAKKISEVVGIPVDDLFFEYELSKLERTAV